MKKLLFFLAIFASQTLVAQNVGIGTTLPGAQLHIAGTNLLDTARGAIMMSRYWTSATDTRSSAIYHLFNSTSGKDQLVFGVSGDGGVYTSPTLSSNAKMVIQANGNVGIGTTTPVFKLDVKNGSINTDSVYRIGATTVLAVPETGNLFIGKDAGMINTGSYNTFSGNLAGSSNTTGGSNSFFGQTAGYVNSSGDHNSFFGRSAGSGNTFGNSNSFYGRSAAYANTSGNYNTAIGNSSLTANTTGTLNTALGYNANVNTGAQTNATVIGANARVDCDNCLVLGSVNGINGATSGVNVGIGTTTPLANLHIRNGLSGATPFPSSFLAVESSVNTYMNLLAPAVNETAILFGQPGSAANGVIMYNNPSTPNGFQFRNNGNVTRMIINNTGSVGIGATPPNASAALDVSSTDKGFLPPRMTSTQRDAIPSPVAGLQIWCIDCKQLQVYDGSVWRTASEVNTFYPFVRLCCQSWMSKNLEVANYSNGDPIPKVTDNAAWAALTTGAYCYYNNDSATYAATYGKLYNWYAVNDPRGLAPMGWHIPTDFEWTALSSCLGGDAAAGGAMKEIGTTHWLTPNTGATNISRFTGLPGSLRATSGSFSNVGLLCYWWSSTENDTPNAWFRGLFYANGDISRGNANKQTGFSVRCLKD